MEHLELTGLEVALGYLSLDNPKRGTHTGGYKRRVSVQSKSELLGRSWDHGRQTVQNRAEVFHFPDVFVRWSFRGTNYFKYFRPETVKYILMEREEEDQECKRRSDL